MDFVREPKAVQQFGGEGLLSGERVKWREKKIGELTGIFANEQALADHADELAYRVANQNFVSGSPKKGAFQWGVTYLEPFTVDGECGMTRGHFHADRDYDEYYFGLAGDGFLLFWDGGDDFFAEKIYPGSLHHIGGHYAHRIINSGDVRLIVGAASSPASGQDYRPIEEHGFPYRCFKRGGEVVWVKNGQ